MYYNPFKLTLSSSGTINHIQCNNQYQSDAKSITSNETIIFKHWNNETVKFIFCSISAIWCENYCHQDVTNKTTHYYCFYYEILSDNTPHVLKKARFYCFALSTFKFDYWNFKCSLQTKRQF